MRLRSRPLGPWADGRELGRASRWTEEGEDLGSLPLELRMGEAMGRDSRFLPLRARIDGGKSSSSSSAASSSSSSSSSAGVRSEESLLASENNPRGRLLEPGLESDDADEGRLNCWEEGRMLSLILGRGEVAEGGEWIEAVGEVGPGRVSGSYNDVRVARAPWEKNLAAQYTSRHVANGGWGYTP